MVRLISGVLVLLSLVACQSSSKVPVSNRSMQANAVPRTYVAKEKDNLFLVAMRYGLDYQKLARQNNIAYPYRLRKGQTVRLDGRAATRTSSALVSAKPVRAPKPRPVSKPQLATKIVSPVKADKKTTRAYGIHWQWPVRGKIVQTFSNSPADYQGLDIQAARGTKIYAAAEGIVVYAGDDGLEKYGKLVIVNHNDLALSAYAHNDSLAVTEGQEVKRGQAIATMGKSGTDTVKLHFEIRKEGESVDPQKILP